MTNRLLTDAEMDRLDMMFGAALPPAKDPEMTQAQKIATVFVLGISFAAILIL